MSRESCQATILQYFGMLDSKSICAIFAILVNSSLAQTLDDAQITTTDSADFDSRYIRLRGAAYLCDGSSESRHPWHSKYIHHEW